MKTTGAIPGAGYIPWCRIEVRHDYFSGEACPGTELIPTPSTAKAMARLGLVARWVGTQFTLYLPSPGRGARWMEILLAQEFTFRLVSRSEGFQYYTALPMEEGKILYLTTRSGGKPAGGKLTEKQDVSAADLLPLTSGAFIFEPAMLLARGGTLEVCDRRGVTVTSAKVPASRKCAIDATPFGPGRYTIESAGKTISSFVAETGLSGAPAVALVSIFGADVPTGGKPPVYTVTWPARSTVWRYDLIPDAPSTDTFKITEASAGARSGGAGAAGRSKRGGPALVTFKQLKHVTDAPTQDSISFESDPARPIPMRARPSQQFQLLRGGRVLIEALPTPALSFNRGADGAGLCSRMFVHL